MKQDGERAWPGLMTERVALVFERFVHEGILSHCRRAGLRAAEANASFIGNGDDDLED
jgi:hypothetical protein